jgi:hypothetical protein
MNTKMLYKTDTSSFEKWTDEPLLPSNRKAMMNLLHYFAQIKNSGKINHDQFNALVKITLSNYIEIETGKRIFELVNAKIDRLFKNY